MTDICGHPANHPQPFFSELPLPPLLGMAARCGSPAEVQQALPVSSMDCQEGEHIQETNGSHRFSHLFDVVLKFPFKQV